MSVHEIRHAEAVAKLRTAHTEALARAEPFLAVIRKFLHEDLPRAQAAFEAGAPPATTPDGPSHDLAHGAAYQGLLCQAEGMRALLRGIEPGR
jgi:hypothetical protein